MPDVNTIRDRDGDGERVEGREVKDLAQGFDMLRFVGVDPALTELGARVLVVPDEPDTVCLDDSSTSCNWHSWTSELQSGLVILKDLGPHSGDIDLPNEVRTIVQSCNEVDFTLIHRQHDKATERYRFYFEPHGHDLLYEDMKNDRVSFTNLPLNDRSYHEPDPDRRLLEADNDNVIHLSPGCYRVNLGGLLLEIKILPRGECFLVPRIDMPPLGPAHSQQLRPSSGTSRKHFRSSGGLDSSSAEQPLAQRRRGNESADVSSEIMNRVLLVDIAMNRTMEVPQSGFTRAYRLTKHRELYDSVVTKVIVATKDEEETQCVVKFTKFTKFTAGIHTLDHWLHEYQIHRDLNHPSIVQFLGADARYLALRLEFIDGKNLVRMADDNHTYHWMSDDDDRVILKGIAGAILYLHDKGIVHNDIKASNIVLSPSRGPFLCAFGNASRVSEPIRPGTYGYDPPEFADHKKGPPGDIWALGVTLLYVTGRIGAPEMAECSGSGSQSLDRQGFSDEITSMVSRLDPENEMDNLIKSMLNSDPALRITAKDLVRELEA